MDLKNFPKIELHLHLDCSLSFEVVRKLRPGISRENYESAFQADDKCHSLVAYLEKAVRGFELMQDPYELELVTMDLFSQLKADGVIYAEIRFAPHLHLKQGLGVVEVVDIVDTAMRKGTATTGVDASLILCTLRHFSEAMSMETVKLVEQFKGTTVVGLDIAADEAGFPIDNHIAAFKYARQNGLHATAHAGEACGPESVWETLRNFEPSRIGHGVRSIEDPELIKYLFENQIHLEVCPTSNLKTGVYDRIEDHPANRIYDSGVSMGISTDGRTISNVTLEEEYGKLQKYFGWEKAHFIKCNLNAIEAAFTTREKKDELIKRFRGILKD